MHYHTRRNTMKSILTLFILTSALLLGQSPKEQEALKENIIKQLKDFQPVATTKKLPVRQRMSFAKKIHYIRVFNKGFVKLGKEQWVYLITVPDSHHTDHKKGLTFAIDQNGTLYENHAHVCAGIVRFGSRSPLPQTSKTFFSSFHDLENKKTWQKVDIHNNL